MKYKIMGQYDGEWSQIGEADSIEAANALIFTARSIGIFVPIELIYENENELAFCE